MLGKLNQKVNNILLNIKNNTCLNFFSKEYLSYLLPKLSDSHYDFLLLFWSYALLIFLMTFPCFPCSMKLFFFIFLLNSFNEVICSFQNFCFVYNIHFCSFSQLFIVFSSLYLFLSCLNDSYELFVANFWL